MRKIGIIGLGNMGLLHGKLLKGRKGVAVVSAAPDRLPGALADEYLELKQSGSL